MGGGAGSTDILISWIITYDWNFSAVFYGFSHHVDYLHHRYLRIFASVQKDKCVQYGGLNNEKISFECTIPKTAFSLFYLLFSFAVISHYYLSTFDHSKYCLQVREHCGFQFGFFKRLDFREFHAAVQ